MFFFFFNDTATTEIYTLSLHDALPISGNAAQRDVQELDPHRPDHPGHGRVRAVDGHHDAGVGDRKSTRLNSSHSQISYAVFCLKKKRNLSIDCASHV